MRVMVNGSTAEWVEVVSKVPQGSVLGPMLFLLYVDDLASLVKSNIKLFVDDTKIWANIKAREDANLLKLDLITLEEWSDKWLLKFNLDKCEVMHIHQKQDTEYSLQSGQITQQEG
jgi:ribonuclease P/MRP protein subunit RPP40